jgi:glycerophosphoryl diester phosphodiesterase
MADSPFIVAHRAGNDLDLLHRAKAARAGVIEADVHLFRGRLEVRHLKTLGPLPILWDRWYLAPRRTPRLELHEVLDAVQPEAALMLDLKGRNSRLSRAVLRALEGSGVQVSVCSRSWRLLEPFAGHPDVRVVHSVGSRRQLRALRRRFAGRRLGGISIHQRLLDAATVAELRERSELIVSWPVESAAEARRLWAWGVHGVTTERFEALAGVTA